MVWNQGKETEWYSIRTWWTGIWGGVEPGKGDRVVLNKDMVDRDLGWCGTRERRQSGTQ